MAMGKTISGQWWELYRSTRLNQVVEQAIANNPSLTEARATLAQARQAILQAQGAYYPQFDVNASAQRQRTSGLGGGSPATSNLYSVGAMVSYNFDFFGGTRRQVEQEAALADYQYYQLAAAYLTLTGNAVTQAINIASISQQIITVQNIIADDEKNLKLVRLKFKGGKAARSDVLTAESQLANDRVALPPLRQQLRVAEHALLIATGKFPGSGTAPEFDLGELSLPVELPLIIPSQLVHQRPDILAAEAQLHAKSAAIGVAASQIIQASRYPLRLAVNP
ncbi:MAG: efflux transporter outer membrane subunit [Gammaproteobacteria bacterium]